VREVSRQPRRGILTSPTDNIHRKAKEHEMETKPHDEKSETSAQESQDAAARATGSVKFDITPTPGPVRDAIEDIVPGDSDGH